MGRKLQFFFYEEKEKWTCDQIRIVEYPNLTTAPIMENLTTFFDQDNGDALFSGNSEPVFSIHLQKISMRCLIG